MRMISLRRLLSKLTLIALAGGGGADALAADANADTGSEQAAELGAEEHVDPRDAGALLGRSLAQALDEMPALAATHVATSWALAEDPLRRSAVAHALEWTFPLFGDSAILEHLSRDTDPHIRIACARAVWVRRRSGIDHAVFARLADDPDPEVRAIAARAGLQ